MTIIQYFEMVCSRNSLQLPKMGHFQILMKFSNPGLIHHFNDYHMSQMNMLFVIFNRANTVELIYKQKEKQMCQEILSTESKCFKAKICKSRFSCYPVPPPSWLLMKERLKRAELFISLQDLNKLKKTFNRAQGLGTVSQKALERCP